MTCSIPFCCNDDAVIYHRKLKCSIPEPFFYIAACPATADKQARLLEFGEDVKKKLCFLSEVVPDGTVKRSLAASFAIMAAGFFIFPRHSEAHFELKTSEFCCEMKF